MKKFKKLLAGLLAGTTQGDALVDHAVVADDGGLPHDDAHAVVDEKAPADLGAGVDLDAELAAAARRKPAGQAMVAAGPEPVLAAIRPDGPQARGVEDDAYR